MEINRKLSLKGCWKMVNKIQLAATPEGIRARCRVAQEWLDANQIISTEEYDELMQAMSYQFRESFHVA